MNIFNKTGKMALGSRLRMLTSKVTEDATKIYNMYHIDFAPKWFPVFYILSEEGEKTITDIATDIGHSQPSVSKIIREMNKAGLLIQNISSTDKRRNVVALSDYGHEISTAIKDQYKDVDAAIEQMTQEATHNLWEAIEEWEYLLEQKSLLARVRAQKKKREIQDVTIVPYKEEHHSAFKALNEAWISTYFEMEDADYKALDNPTAYILNKGGYIFVALYHDKVVGVCALIKMEDNTYDYELAKMAVAPAAKGKSIGYLLGQTAIQKAKTLGASTLYLESNTILKPAINLYNKLGFKKIVGHTTPYKRCNIQMTLDLHD